MFTVSTGFSTGANLLLPDVLLFAQLFGIVSRVEQVQAGLPIGAIQALFSMGGSLAKGIHTLANSAG